MASFRGRSTAHKHLFTILQVISSGRRSSYAEHANPYVERPESDSSKLLTVGVEDSLPNLRRQGDAESLEKECDPTEAEAVPWTTHLCVNIAEEEVEKESEALPRGKATNSSPPCSARHGEEANRDPATPPEVESSPPRETAEEEDEAEGPKRPGYLHLLVEAARLLEPGFGEDGESGRGSDRDSRKRAAIMEPAATAAKRRRRRRDWAAAYLGAFEEDVAPVVRSKRGRNQVLPSRYRDSVIEPWKAAPRPSW